MPRQPKRDLAQLGRDYGDFIFAAFERLCADDGKTIATEDLKAFETWNASKVLALERQLRAEGLTASDISVWRAGYRDQFRSKMSHGSMVGSTFEGKFDDTDSLSVFRPGNLIGPKNR
jgi:hypothetical protein